MLITNERRPAVRTLRGWAISVLQEAGAIRECEEHGWMKDRADPHCCERALISSRARIRPLACHRARLLPRSRPSRTRLAIPARNARPIAARLLPSSCYRGCRADRPRASFRQTMARLIHSWRCRPLAGTASFMAASASLSGRNALRSVIGLRALPST
jgi:hypothetical protein